jgi:aspartyl protease family protein
MSHSLLRRITSMRPVITFAVMALLAAMIVPRYAEQMNARAARPSAMAPPTAALVNKTAVVSGSVVVPRDAYGHFRADGRVNGRYLEFVVDTGASVVALTADDAAQLGIHPSESDYTVVMRTANGTIRAAPTRLDMVEVGDILVRDVRAVVMPDGSLSENLLGMSFLSQLRHFDYSDGTMVLEQ